MPKPTQIVPFSESFAKLQSDQDERYKAERQVLDQKISALWQKCLSFEDLYVWSDLDKTTYKWLMHYIHPTTNSNAVELISSSETTDIHFRVKEVCENITNITDSESRFSWDFSVLNLNESELAEFAVSCFEIFDFSEHLSLNITTLRSIVEKTLKAHQVKNGFYDKYYAVQTLHVCVLCLIHSSEELTQLLISDVLALLFSCLIFSVNYKSSKSTIRDESLFYFFSEVAVEGSENDILKLLPSSNDAENFKKQITQCVRSMDYSKHAVVLRTLERLVEKKQPLISAVRRKSITGVIDITPISVRDKMETLIDRHTIMSSICIVSSISYVCKSLENAQKWLQKNVQENAMEESVQNSDKPYLEPLIGINHIDFIAAPFWTSLSHFFDNLEQPVAYMITNRVTWHDSILQQRTTEVDGMNLKKHLTFRRKAFEDTYLNFRFDIESNKLSNWFIGPSNYFLESLTKKIPLGIPSKVNENLRVSEVSLYDPLLEKSIKSQPDNQNAISLPVQISPEQKTSSKLKEIIKRRSFKHKSNEATKRKNSTMPIGNIPWTSQTQFVNKVDEENQSYTRIDKFLSLKVVKGFLLLITLFALFGDDFRLALTDRKADDVFQDLFVLCLLIFTVEMILLTISQKAYLGSFFFWLDLIATVSLLLDIPIIWDWFLGLIDQEDQTSNAHLTLTRAGRASRAGARAAKVLRIMRYVRLLRILKVYEMLHRHKADLEKKLKSRGTMYTRRYMLRRETTVDNYGKQMHKVEKVKLPESKVGAHLADLTTKKVIIMVLVILFGNKFIVRFETDFSYDATIGAIHARSVEYNQSLADPNINSSQARLDFMEYVNSVTTFLPKLLFIRIDALHDSQDESGIISSIADYRNVEVQFITAKCLPCNAPYDGYALCICDQFELSSIAYFNIKAHSQEDAIRNMLQTLFILVMLTVVTFTFTYDAHRLVIAPIEKIVKLVQDLAENPLATLEQSNEKSTQNARYETSLLENCIRKIGTLLKVGFGTAGAEIIAANMNRKGELDPMLPGKPIEAIFGYCNICNFCDVSKILREDVLLFVNEIAEIVHSQVSVYDGQPNRNMGGAFLLVWHTKASQQGEGIGTGGDKNSSLPEEGMDIWSVKADKALISFLKVIVQIYANPALRSLSDKEDFFGRELHKLINDYKVQVTFGLHKGWAIEGAIGSQRKIDASYLSPNVTMAEVLGGELSKIYNNKLLMSGEFYDLLSDDAKKCTRQIDEIAVTHSEKTLRIYTFDVVVNSNLETRLKSIRLKREDTANTIDNDRRISLLGPNPIIDHIKHKVDIEKLTFRTDLELRALQWDIPTHFLPLSHKAVKIYLSGNWKDAKVFYEAMMKLVPSEKNGSISYVYEYMKEHGFVAPDNWKGYREDVILKTRRKVS